ncbi:MAG TPA: DUF2851 family protein [Cytophagales bacterium]|nr:DUF2851 family protein [Cytophagales bacterium]
MPDFKEYFLQHVWKYQLFEKQHLKSSNGQGVSIIKTGHWNPNAGPDFLNAEVIVDRLKWYGSVEVHIKASDWQRHAHDNDKNYNNVILHVVWVDDVLSPSMPTLELKGRIPEHYIANYDKLVKSNNTIPCARQFAAVNSIYKTEMLERAFFQRVSRKSTLIQQNLAKYNGDWEQVAYHMILKNFGFHVNEEAFAQIAEHLPIKILAKHRDQIMQVEALLMGVSGLLVGSSGDAYYMKMREEYLYFKAKYVLDEIHIPLKFLRLRPANFPTVRLSQFADLVVRQSHLFSLFNDTSDYLKLAHQLKCRQSSYWQKHYVFGKAAETEVPYMGKSSIDLLLINTLVPLLITYAQVRSEDMDMVHRALQILHQIKPEVNHKTKVWQDVGFIPSNSYDSQALIEWLDAFCTQKKCLDCSIGLQILKLRS